MNTGTFFQIVAELGLPIVATIGMGMFVLIIMKYILGGIVATAQLQDNIITQLDERVKSMNTEIVKLDQEISQELGLPVDTDRISRADKKDIRKD